MSETRTFFALVHSNTGLFVSVLVAGAVPRGVSQNVKIGALVLLSNKRQQEVVQFLRCDMIYCNSLFRGNLSPESWGLTENALL